MTTEPLRQCNFVSYLPTIMIFYVRGSNCFWKLSLICMSWARHAQEGVAVEQATALQPDIVVLDISMPDMDGLEACQHIRRQHPDIQVLILTMHESEEYFLQALRMDASGYLVKKAAPPNYVRLSVLSHKEALFSTQDWQKH